MLPAGSLYVGRGALEAKRAALVGSADHWIVSAGLGLVASTKKVPAYDLTVSGNGPNQIRTKITGETYSNQAWWKEIARGHAISRLVYKNPDSLIVLALPSTYLNMVQNDLSQISTPDLQRIRLIGPPRSTVPKQLLPFWMPYDQRLNGPASPIPGTGSDFAQRAARHFFEKIWPRRKKSCAMVHAAVIAEILESLPLPSIPKRKRLDDQQIVRVICRLWKRAEGRSGLMLRILRDEKQIACEQSRFKTLFSLAMQEMGVA